MREWKRNKSNSMWTERGTKKEQQQYLAKRSLFQMDNEATNARRHNTSEWREKKNGKNGNRFISIRFPIRTMSLLDRLLNKFYSIHATKIHFVFRWFSALLFPLRHFSAVRLFMVLLRALRALFIEIDFESFFFFLRFDSTILVRTVKHCVLTHLTRYFCFILFFI